jgi:tetratricopeptide (TPR) repeat protein
MVRALLLCVLALAAACAAPGPHRSAITRAELLAPGVSAISPETPALISREEAYALDAEMRAFVAAQIGDTRDPRTKLRRLLRGMEERGLFSFEYANDSTRTARAAFHDRQGNCLSFTMLFVALAREAGLEATFQIVDVPPTWFNSSSVVVVSTHINSRVAMPYGSDYVVDFNLMNTRSTHPTREVADSYALALFYNNLGAEALIGEEYELSFRYLKAAIETHAGIPDSWTNLGVLYARQARYQHADAAYLQALSADRGNRTALTNLVSLHAALGNQELADAYRQRVRRYQQRNPYYHYAAAEDAYRDHRYEDALAALNRALRLKRDEDEFHALHARVRLELDEL